MTDVRTMLSHAAAPAEVTEETVAADLARGRRGVRRRAARRAAGSLVTAAVVVAGVGVARSEPTHRPAPNATVAAPTPKASPTRLAARTLVAYTGAQPSGYRVAYVPKGWEIQGANELRMTIAPIGTTDRDPDAFEGKLVVMLQSSSATGQPAGTPVKVGNGTGYLNRAEAPTAVLTFQDSKRHWVVVQVPSLLGWSDGEIARFGAGVEITRNAAPGLG
ncbi:MAG: hypothetical protein QOE45_2922 [Frankiaceae bacterium]|jgi:hypothetical protein|nr:hypothetical protein [Frankiaceae bacterium]